MMKVAFSIQHSHRIAVVQPTAHHSIGQLDSKSLDSKNTFKHTEVFYLIGDTFLPIRVTGKDYFKLEQVILLPT